MFYGSHRFFSPFSETASSTCPSAVAQTFLPFTKILVRKRVLKGFFAGFNAVDSSLRRKGMRLFF
jgi:hypothetical protein